MNKAQKIKFDSLYQQHVNALKRQGKADATMRHLRCNVFRRALKTGPVENHPLNKPWQTKIHKLTPIV